MISSTALDLPDPYRARIFNIVALGGTGKSALIWQ
jgi:hypothetical protein